VNNREFLKKRCTFKNLVSIEDSEILSKIHLNYRLIYLKDTAAARWIEENTLGVLANVSK
jgi:hypothetical protein